MESFFEKANPLRIGRITIDYSNIPAYLITRAATEWNSLAEKKMTIQELQNERVKIALLMVRHPLFVMSRRMSIFKAVKEWIKQRMVTAKSIMNMNRKELDYVHNELLKPILGDVKKKMEREEQMVEVANSLIEAVGKEAYVNLLSKLAQSPDIDRTISSLSQSP